MFGFRFGVGFAFHGVEGGPGVGFGVVLAAGEAAGFELFEVGEGGVELVLKSGNVAAQEFLAVVGAGGPAPGCDDEADVVDFFEFLEDFFGVDAARHVEEGGVHHGEAFETPVEVGDLFDEAGFGFRCGSEVVEEGVDDFFVLGGVFGFED